MGKRDDGASWALAAILAVLVVGALTLLIWPHRRWGICLLPTLLGCIGVIGAAVSGFIFFGGSVGPLRAQSLTLLLAFGVLYLTSFAIQRYAVFED
jgi:multidrug transporter EmrE-like cation transporter